MNRTKILATVGPASRSVSMLRELISAGVDVFRLNFSHGTLTEHRQALDAVREAAQRESAVVAVMGDLCGPKIRVGEMAGGAVEIHEGRRLIIQRSPVAGTAQRISTNYPAIVDEIVPPAAVLIDDGRVRLSAVEKNADEIVCEVQVAGIIQDHKGINLPDTHISTPALTEKDRTDARWAVENDLDFLALSFVRRAEDVHDLRRLLHEVGGHQHIIPKIEKPEAIDHLEEIVAASDAVLVARGDLGVEMDVAQVPLLQKEISRLCQEHNKPVIIATQMLQSMVDEPVPTRAEASDVANAVLDGADAVMLSAETAVGKYPVEAVRMMSRIASESEAYSTRQQTGGAEDLTEVERRITSALAGSAAFLARRLGAKAVAVRTDKGNMVRLMSKYRLDMPILGLARDDRISRRMVLYYGTVPIRMEHGRTDDELLAGLEEYLMTEGLAQAGDMVVLLSDQRTGPPQTTRNLVISQIGMK